MRTIKTTTTTTIKPGTRQDRIGTSFSRVYLNSKLSAYKISTILQINPFKEDDDKVTLNWIIKVGTKVITIYDYKGHRWHVGGNMTVQETLEVLKQLFDEKDIIPEESMRLIKIK